MLHYNTRKEFGVEGLGGLVRMGGQVAKVSLEESRLYKPLHIRLRNMGSYCYL
jgi:hypothetical protein